MIITIDGPAGAGKSTVAKLLASRLGFQFLDTGAMYRAVTWAALETGCSLSDHDAIADLASRISIEFSDEGVFVDGREVTAEIRALEVTRAVSEIADNPEVREHLVMLQREIAAAGDHVCEGRDQGTIVFPNADCKIYLTASNTERARRRHDELLAAGQDVDFEFVLADQEIRDQRDATRPCGRLQKADDAIEIVTDGRLLREVVDMIEDIARERIFNL